MPTSAHFYPTASEPSLRKARAERSALSDSRVWRNGQLESKIFRAKFRATDGTVPSFFSWKPETVLFFLAEKEKNGFGKTLADRVVRPYMVR